MAQLSDSRRKQRDEAKENAKRKAEANKTVTQAVKSGAAYKPTVKQDDKTTGAKPTAKNTNTGGRSAKAVNGTTRKPVTTSGNSGGFGAKSIASTDGRGRHEEKKKQNLQTLTQNSIRWHQTQDEGERARLKQANDKIRAQYGLQYNNGKTYLPTANGRKYLSKAVDRYTGRAAASDTYNTQAAKTARYDEIQSEIDRLQEENPYLLSREASDRKLASVPYFISHPSKIGTAMQGAGKYDAMNDEQKKNADALYAYYQTLVNEQNALATTGALKTLAGSAANTTGSILEVPENIVRLAKAGVNNAVGEAAGLFGLDKVRDFYKKDAENTMKNSFVGSAMQKMNDWAQPVGMTQKSQELSGQVARMLPGIAAGGVGAAASSPLAAGAAGLGNAGLAMIFADSTASSARQALNEGANMNRALMYGVGSGAVEVGTEKLFGGIPGLNEGLVKLGGSNPILGKAADIAGEGLEEAASTFINPYLQRATYNPNAQNATARELWDSAKGGMLVSGIMQGASGIMNRAGNRQYDATPTEAATSIHDANADMRAADAMDKRLNPDTPETQGTPAAPLNTGNGQMLSGAANAQTAPSLADVRQQRETLAARDISPKLTRAGAETAQDGLEAKSRDTAIDTNPATHTPAQMAQINEYINSSDAELKTYAENVLSGKQNKAYSLQPISDRAAQDIKTQLGIDASGFQTKIEPRIIQHIDKRHGANGAADRSMANLNDLSRMQYVLDHYDTAEPGGTSNAYIEPNPNRQGSNRKAKTIVFKKQIDGSYYVVEAVPVSSAKTAYVTSAFIQKNKENHSTLNARFRAPGFTPENASNSSLLNPSIPQSGANVNDINPKLVKAANGNDIRPKLTKAGVTPESSVGAAEGGFDPYSRMVNEYGAIPEGENPARVVDVPQSTNGEDRVRRGARTFMESGITTDEMIPSFEQEVANGTFSYNVKTDKSALDNAVKTINKKGWQGAYEQWQDVTDGRRTASKDDIVLAETMYSAAVKSGDTQTAMRLAAEIAAEGTRSGQAVQAIKLLKKSTPEGQLYYLQKSVEKIQQDYQKRFDKLDSKAAKKAQKAAKKGIPGAEVAEQHGITLNEDLVQEFLSAADENARKNVVDKIYDDIASQIPATFADRFNAWRYFSMLGNPRTHIRNIVSNAINQIPTKVSNEVSALGQRFLPKAERTRTFKSDASAKEFAKRDFAQMKEELGGSAYTSDMDEIRQRMKPFKDSTLFKWLDKPMDANSRALDAEDMWFKESTYVDSLANFITARGWDANNLTEAQLHEAREHAKNDALVATFNNESKVANKLNDLQRQGKLWSVLIGSSMPFKRTPINIAKRSAALSPAGLAKALTYDAVQVKKGNMTASQMIDNVSTGLTGTAIAGIGALLAAQGVFNAGSSDDDKEANFEAGMGTQEYSINVAGHTYTLDWAAPAIVPMAMGAEIYKAFTTKYEDEDAALNAAFDAVGRMFEPLMNMTMLSGLNSTLQSAAYNQSNAISAVLQNTAQNYAGQVVPTLLGQIARTADNTRRTTYVDKTSAIPSSWQRFAQKQANKIPGLSQNQMPYTDIWGREQKNGPDNIAARAAYNFLSPGYLADAKATNAEKALKELYQATGDSDVLPGKLQASYTDDKGNKVYLTQKQYTTLTSERGKTALDAIDKFTKSEAYRGMSNTQKVDTISDIYKYANEIAANKVYDKELGNTTQKIKDATDENISVGDCIAFNNSVSDITKKNKGSATSEEDNLRDTVDLLESDTFKNMTEQQKDYLFASTGRSTQYNPYHESEVEKNAESNDYYKGLGDTDKLYFRSFANEYEDAVKNGKKLDGWIAKAKLASDHGVIEPYQYVAYQHALLYANTDNNDNYKQSEVTAAINSLSGLTQQQKAYLWQSANKQWKPGKNPFGSATVYWPEEDKKDGSAGAKIEKRVGAMMGSGK